jgi:CheY-like chemotaxis protein
MSEATALPPLPPPCRVLLLDDDRFTLELLNAMLCALGTFEVQAETDARHALGALAARAPDLLICDLVLPGMDGIEFLQAAAARGFDGRVILLSGTDSAIRDAAAGLARALGLQVAGAFDKPIRLDQLRQAVER